MSSAPSNGKTGTTTAARGRTGSIDKPVAKAGAKPKPKEMTPEQKKHLLIGSVAFAVVLGMGALIYAYFYKSPVDPNPRLNAPPESIATFVSTSNFNSLDFDRKKLYIKELSGKKKEMEELNKAGKLTNAQFEEVKALMWIGKQFKHVEKYNSLGPLDRKDMLDEIIDDNKRHPSPKDPEREKRVKAMEETFPSYDREQIRMFRQALKEREKERNKEDMRIRREAPARVSTRPTTRPASPLTPAKTPAATSK